MKVMLGVTLTETEPLNPKPEKSIYQPRRSERSCGSSSSCIKPLVGCLFVEFLAQGAEGVGFRPLPRPLGLGDSKEIAGVQDLGRLWQPLSFQSLNDLGKL